MVVRPANGTSSFRLFSTLVAVILVPELALAAQNYVTLDYGGGFVTEVHGINNKSIMVGSANNGAGWHAFVLQNGLFTTIDFPNAFETFGSGINDRGDIVGYYLNSQQGSPSQGFLLSNGIYTSIYLPNTNTFVGGINNVGQVVGWYQDAGGTHGFLWSAGSYSYPIDFFGSTNTRILGINNAGLMVGDFVGIDGRTHGFSYQKGTFSPPIDYPSSTGTIVSGVNDLNMMVGTYFDGSINFGFELNDGSFTKIQVPGGFNGTYVWGTNNAAQLTGRYSAFTDHGFVSAVGPFAYVANTNDDTVSVIDIPTSLVLTTIAMPTGSGPWGTAISPDGKQVYVTNNRGNSVSVIDAASNAVVATIPNIQSPLGVAFTPPDGSQVYVVNGSTNRVSVIDTTSHSVVHTVQVGSSPVGVAMALTTSGPFAYVNNSADNTVSVITVGSNPSVKNVPVGSAPAWVTVTPNSKLVYVENAGNSTISVLSVEANNSVIATIPVGPNPYGAAFTPDSSTAYVASSGSNAVSVIDTTSNTVVATVQGLNQPRQVALSTDGAIAYATNQNNTVSVIDTASNTVVRNAPVGSAPIGVAMASLAPSDPVSIQLQLSPTDPNVFNFGTENYVVQYPQGTNFSNVTMTTTEVQIAPAEFRKRVANTQFADATCIVYAGAGGNCVDHQVTCSDSTSGNPIQCPSEPQPTIEVETNFTTSQSITNPGYLTATIGQNDWQNIFTDYVGVDSNIKVKGNTTGFSEFVAVDLGVGNNPPERAQLQALTPQFPATFAQGSDIPVQIQLSSVPDKKPITNAEVKISVMLLADSQGNPVHKIEPLPTNSFTNSGSGTYDYVIPAAPYALGTYGVTIYGDAFTAFQGQFTIVAQGVIAQVKPTSLDFGYQLLGTTSSPLRDSLFNVGNAKVTISNVQVTGDFQIQTNHCLSGVKPGTHCDVYVTFSPTAEGTRTGTLYYYDNAQGSPQIVSLSGLGTRVHATTTTLSSSPNPSAYGQAVTFTAVITSSGGAPPNGEIVSFMNGTTLLKTVTMSGGVAKFKTSTLKVGTTSVTAVYGGDPNFFGSTSNAVRQVVKKATTTTTLISSQNPSNVGQPVTFTATVKPQFSGTVKGTVTFYDGTTLLKTVALSGGVSTFTTATLTSGTHNITAKYNGNAKFLVSSASLTQTIN
jgi:YVTN family beta-propeller protein/probable HAF family extracellular repeat protein